VRPGKSCLAELADLSFGFEPETVDVPGAPSTVQTTEVYAVLSTENSSTGMGGRAGPSGSPSRGERSRASP